MHTYLHICMYVHKECKRLLALYNILMQTRCSSLVSLLKTQLRELNFTRGQLDILSSFLNPDEMQRHPEAPLPADAREEILEFVGEQVRPKVRNVKELEKFDPIHSLFYPKDEKEGKYRLIKHLPQPLWTFAFGVSIPFRSISR